MKRRASFLPGLILIAGAVLPAPAQKLGAPVITNYETEQIQALSQNWAAVQDRRGIMYFANNAGILEFDGLHWRLIPVLGNATVRDLAFGPDGTLFYGSVDDFGYLAASPSGEVFAVSLGDAIPAAARAFADVWQVVSAVDGVYFLTRSRIFRLHGGRITVLAGRLASSQACLLNGHVFFADADRGLCLLAGDKVLPIPQLAGVYNGTRIALAPFSQPVQGNREAGAQAALPARGAVRDRRHQLLAGRASGDFLRIDLEPLWDEAAQRYDPSRPAPANMVAPFACELDEFIKVGNGFIYRLVPLGADVFAVCSVRGGIAIFDQNGKAIRSINTSSDLLDNTVLNLFLDRARNLWCCSNAGISHIEMDEASSYFDSRNNIRGISICARFHQGRMVVGTFEGLLLQASQRFALRDDRPIFVPLKDSPAQIWQLLDVDGDLMAATASGLFHIRGDRAVKAQGSSATTYCLAASRLWPGHLFAGLTAGGMEVYRRAAGRWRLEGRIEGIEDNVRSIAQDSRGDLWAGTETRGLLRLLFAAADPTKPHVQRFGPEQGLPVRSYLKAIARGETLFVLSSSGLFRTAIPRGQARPPERIRFTQDAVLGKAFRDPPVALRDMVFAPDGDVFFNTSQGISWASPGRDGNYRMDPRPFRGVPAQDGTMYLHPDGSIWLTGKRLYRVDPHAAKDYGRPFSVLIRRVTAGSQRILFHGTYGRPGTAFSRRRTVFEKLPDPGDIPSLPYKENSVSFQFAAAFFEKPGDTRFQYRLEGFDKGWSGWTADTKKEYTNLPEGKYRFRVRARNVYGTLGEEAGFGLRILPPWTRTPWAYLLWTLGGVAGLLGFIYLYTLNLRHQKDRLEKTVAERTRQLHDASQDLLQATLTDPLTGLRNRRYMHEVLQGEVDAFLKRKQFLLGSPNQRGAALEDAVFGMFLVDIDFFKMVNDIHGHDAGDRVLRQFASLLMESLRQDDAVLRLGGEEFLLVLKDVAPGYLGAFAAKILQRVADTRFDIGGGETLRKTCSIGYVALPVYRGQPGLLTFEQCTMIADLGLLYAKAHGRAQAVLLEAGPRLPSGREEIRKAVTSLEFALAEGFLRIQAPDS